jgi:hypothetical protein
MENQMKKRPSLYILDKNGKPKPCKDVLKWGKAQEAPRSLKKTEIGDILISTVFLGLDHQHGDGPPLLWETMIFGGKHDQYQERYSSREEALEGHIRAVNLVAK